MFAGLPSQTVIALSKSSVYVHNSLMQAQVAGLLGAEGSLGGGGVALLARVCGRHPQPSYHNMYWWRAALSSSGPCPDMYPSGFTLFSEKKSFVIQVSNTDQTALAVTACLGWFDRLPVHLKHALSRVCECGSAGLTQRLLSGRQPSRTP